MTSSWILLLDQIKACQGAFGLRAYVLGSIPVQEPCASCHARLTDSISLDPEPTDLA